MDKDNITEEELDRQIDSLKSTAAESIHRGITAMYIAVNNPEIRQLVLRKTNELEHTFKGMQYLNTPNLLEILVYFEFENNSDAVLLVQPTFAANVDLETKRVTAVFDPFVVASANGVDSPSAGRTFEPDIGLRRDWDTLLADVDESGELRTTLSRLIDQEQNAVELRSLLGSLRGADESGGVRLLGRPGGGQRRGQCPRHIDGE